MKIIQYNDNQAQKYGKRKIQKHRTFLNISRTMGMSTILLV